MPSHSLQQSTRSSDDRRSYSADSTYYYAARINNNAVDADVETMDNNMMEQRRKLDTGASLNREIEHKKALVAAIENENTKKTNNDDGNVVVPKRLHFFATPSNHDPRSGLLRDTKIEEVDEQSRNPPLSQERDWMLEGAQSIFRILQKKKKSSTLRDPPPHSSRTTHVSSEFCDQYNNNLQLSIPTRRRAQSVPKTRLELDCDYDEYSSRLRDEMRKFQLSVRGSAKHASGPSLSLDSRHHHQVPIKVVETVDRGAQINTIIDDGNHNHQLSKESEIVQLRTQLDDMMKDRLEDSQLRSRQWQAVGIESENLNLKQQLVDMQRAADDDAYKMTQMAEAYTVAMDEIEREYERSLELAIQEGKDLRMKLRNYQEDNERVISSAMKENELLREELHTCRMENEISIKATMKDNEFLREELHTCRFRNEELQENELSIKATMRDNEFLKEELHKCRHEIRLLKDENLDVNTRCKAAEQESESRRRIIINIECKYDDLKRKCEDEINNIKDDHRQCIEDNTGLMVELREITKERNHLNRKIDELAHSIEAITVEKEDAENLLNSTLRQRENNENELHREIRQLQVELNDANTERGVDEREIRLLTNKLHATQEEFYVVREELGIAMEERDVMKSRLVLVDELTNALEVAIANDEEKTLSIDRLKDELQRALADKAEEIRRYSELEVEYEGLQVMKDSESDLVVLLMKQRDSLTARIEKYMDEIDSMRQERGRGQQERDLLKDELICALETATSIFPQLTPKDLDEMSLDKF